MTEYTIDYLVNTPEGLYLDKKSSRMAPKDIVRHIIAFANANGGVLAIGIEDDSSLAGFTLSNSHTLEEYQTAIMQYCRPLPSISYKKIPYGKNTNEYVLLLCIETSVNQVIRKYPNNEVYLRLLDNSIELDHEQITKLEYDKGQRFFEEIEIPDATIENDIDDEIVKNYCKKMKISTEKPIKSILDARGLIRNNHLTNAALLLFGNNPTKFLPQARIHFIRYNGMKRLTGERINIIKEATFDLAIPKLLHAVSEFIRSQMREFQFLDTNGQFKVITEYPEFAWFEGIVNALTHRDYSISGDQIRISMYDDRLEIFSPGKLPNIVTLENMKYTRFSRNPKIARILSEFGWVKELNEGVNRIYDEMQEFFLNDPIYSEPNNRAVLLVLENSITSRQARAVDKISDLLSIKWDKLSSQEHLILQYLYTQNQITTKELAHWLNISTVTARNKLKKLLEDDLLEWNGSSQNDPNQFYTLKFKS